MRQPVAESDLLPWRKEQCSTKTTDTPNTPSSSYNGWKYPSACCKEMKCLTLWHEERGSFHPSQLHKGLGLPCTHVSWFLQVGRWPCIPTGGGHPLGKELLPKGWLHLRERLSLSQGWQSQVGIVVQVFVQEGVYLTDTHLGESKANISIFTFKNRIINSQWSANCFTPVEGCSAVGCGGLPLQCLHPDAPRVGAVVGHWSQAGNANSAHGFRLRQVLMSCTAIYPTPQCHQSNSSLCWVLNQYIESSNH